MKPSPDRQKLEETLRASTFAAGGFMGADSRPLDEILEADAAQLRRAGRTAGEVAERMREITAQAQAGLGSWVKVGENTEAMTTDTRGSIPCPWPHPGVFPKTVTVVKQMDSSEQLFWSTLSIHLIEAHGFFQGKGSAFRLDPAALVSMLYQ